MSISRITRFYRFQPIDLNGINAVRQVLNSSFDSNALRRYRLIYPSDEIEVKVHDDVAHVFASRGPTFRFSILAKTSAGRYALFDATHFDRIFVDFTSAQLNVTAEVQKIEQAVSLRPLQRLVQSAFIAHGFDDKGKRYALEVAEFLRLLGIAAITGEYFEPVSISEKVKRWIVESDIFIAIVTPQDDLTWIVQETTFADSLDKQPFILVENTVEPKRGLRGDHEDIFFPEGHISESFIKLLQGIRKLRGDIS
jgi:hypothetical protein